MAGLNASWQPRVACLVIRHNVTTLSQCHISVTMSYFCHNNRDAVWVFGFREVQVVRDAVGLEAPASGRQARMFVRSTSLRHPSAEVLRHKRLEEKRHKTAFLGSSGGFVWVAFYRGSNNW